MDQQEYLSISLALILGLYATITDFKTRKIPNLCTFGLLWAGITSQAIFLISGLTTLKFFAFIFTASAALSFGAYWLGVFAPGDAKLYWGMTLLLPPSLFEGETTVTTFPPAVLLMNLFVIYLCWTLLQTVLFTSLSEKKRALQTMLHSPDLPKQLLFRGLSLLQFVAIAFYVSFFQSQFHLKLGILLTLLWVILLYQVVRVFAKKQNVSEPWQTLLIAFPCGLMGLMTPGFLFLLGWRLMLLGAVYLCLLPLILHLFLNLDSLRFSKTVNIFQLQPGMIPAEQIVQIKGEDGISITKEPALYSKWHHADVIVAPLPEGLSYEKIRELQDLATQGYFEPFENHITVQHASHFAIFILLGFLLTLEGKGPFYLIRF